MEKLEDVKPRSGVDKNRRRYRNETEGKQIEKERNGEEYIEKYELSIASCTTRKKNGK